MCGIAGIAYSDVARVPEADLLRRMTDILRHRGPDGEGFHAAPGIGLGFRRLAIIDLATGEQPIANEDGSIVVVCNGEIYNHVELRASLEARGHRFRTRSDVETIVHLYEERGDTFVEALRGMFALALWDARRRRLVLARDRFGIKPLYYASAGGALLFASEQKGILASGEVTAKADPRAVRDLLTFGRVRSPRAFAAGISKVPAGHLLTFTEGTVALSRYWDVTFPDAREYEHRSDEAWAEGLRELLAESVRLHMRSDVPVGAWLSGGVDSSSVVALMSPLTASRIPTFTMRADDPADDELDGLRALSDFPEFRLDAHRVSCGVRDFPLFAQGIWHSETQSLGSIAVGQLRVAQASAEHVKVVLCGEGADELLGGYSWYRTLSLLGPLFALSPPLRHLIAAFPPIRRRWPGAAATLAGPEAMNFERYSRSITHLTSQGAARLMSRDLADSLRGAEDELFDSPIPPDFERWHPFARMQYFDIKHRMGDGVVHALDAASMAHSVEARVPFLDHVFAEYCARIPPWVKMRRLREKAVLRRAMRNVLPAEIARRPKWPMHVPVDAWLRGPLPDFAREALSAERIDEAGCFDAAAVAKALELHRARRENLGQALGAVLGVQLWDRMFRRDRRLGV
ncbi:MAG: asparagine synthase (glutamine-hydrolyzing) [Betaproteobacteria bacterium]